MEHKAYELKFASRALRSFSMQGSANYGKIADYLPDNCLKTARGCTDQKPA